MREIVVSMQNTLLSEAVAWSLAETGEFRVKQVLPGKTGDTFSLCRAAQADILLMEVSHLPAYTLENRLKLMMNALTEKTKAPKEMSFIQKTMNLRKGTTL